MFITFEGMDGAGKTTQINLLRTHLIEKGYDVVLSREPGGTKVCEKIREILLDKENMGMNIMCEALLFAASRAEHIEKIIKPALTEGKIVICDRFVHSSLAYQGYGRKLGEALVASINKGAIDGIYPDMTIFIMLDAKSVHSRLLQSGKDHDRLEKETVSFFERVNNGFIKIADSEKKAIIINAEDTIENIHKTIADAVDNIIENKG